MLRSSAPKPAPPPASARHAILRAAERIFSEKGLDGARTEAIARAARVNKALLYYYFKSKSDLFLAVIDEVLQESHLQLMAILSGKGSEREIVVRYVEAMFDALSHRPDSYFLFQRFVMTNPKLIERPMKTLILPRFQKLAAVIKRGVRRGEFRAVDPSQMAISLASLTVHYFSVGPVMKAATQFDPFKRQNLKRRKREIIGFIRYGLFKNPEAPTS